jgi:hypothetical protein
MNMIRMKFLAVVLLLCSVFSLLKAQNWKEIEKTFAQAPDSTRTRVWWFWGEAVVTREGITADLESMKKVGIGGVVLYEQLFGDRTDPIKTLTPEWFGLVKFAGEECARLGLQFDITISSGYCAGGPWITPELSMKRLVCKEYTLDGNKHFVEKLDLDTANGAFYRDAMLLAYNAPSGKSTENQKDRIHLSTNNPNVDVQKLFLIDSKTVNKIAPNTADSSTFINIEFPDPIEARSLSYIVQPVGKSLVISMQLFGNSEYARNALGFSELYPFGQLEYSTDGRFYTKVCDLLPIYRSLESWKSLTRSFPTCKARWFRLKLYNSNNLLLGNVVLREEVRVDQWELKAANRSEIIIPGTTPDYRVNEVLSSGNYVNITDKLKADGTLDWDVPSGNWKVVRLGYVSTRARNKHGRPEATGLECDKLDITGIDTQFENYSQAILNAIKDNTNIKVKSIHIDSAEHGDQNWSVNFTEEFKKRRGYDPVPYLPVMMGYIISSSEVSERFLFDVRKTISEMLADNYFGRLTELAHKNNMLFTAQAPGTAICIHADPLLCKSKVDIPQGEFWVNAPNANYDVKEASSAAHLYNKPIASAETFTGAEFKSYPDFFKPFADGAYAMGINEFVICASTHQPWLNRKPGCLTIRTCDMFQRNNTWWDFSRDFWDYQSRLAYMMRLGKASVDYCYYLGENIPVKTVSSLLKPVPPSGYDFDVCSPDALLNRFSATAGGISIPGGCTYKLLVLPDTNRMSLAVARKLKELVENGAVILGRYPKSSPSLPDLGKGDEEVSRIADELWGNAKSNTTGVHNFGKGKVYWGKTIEEVMKEQNLAPDLKNGTHFWDSEILFTHRKAGEEHIYFIANHKNKAEKSNFTFRVGNMQPELWDPVTGKTRILSDFITNDSTTSIPLEFYSYQSYVIVLKKAIGKIETPKCNFPALKLFQKLDGKWLVHFEPDCGGPASVTFDSLTDWRLNSDNGIKFYSGTVRYEKSFKLKNTRGVKFTLSLGNVANIARVKLNGKLVGNVWCKPWHIDISDFVQPGNNHLEIEVANQWVNRLIGDSGLPEGEKIAYTTFNNFKPDAPLTESGLLGPVQILIQE